MACDVITLAGGLVEQLVALVPPGVSLAHVALCYVLAQPEVSTVIPGAKTVAQVRERRGRGRAAARRCGARAGRPVRA